MDEQNQQTSQPLPSEALTKEGEPPASKLQGETLEAKQPQPKNWVLIIVLVVIAALITSAATYFAVNYQKQTQPQLPTIISPSPSPTPLTKTDDTSNWKTYTNTEKNFSLKYPSDWNLNEDKGEINTFIILLEIRSPKRKFTFIDSPFSLYEVLVSTKSKKGETTIGQEVDRQIQESRSPGIVMDERKKIIVAGGDAEKVTFRQDTGEEVVVVYTMNKDKIYAIVFRAYFITNESKEKFSGEFKTLTDQILSTFKFD